MKPSQFILLALISGLGHGHFVQVASAQDDMDLEMMDVGDDAFSYEPLDVEGEAKKRPSMSDKMKVMRDRMEQKTDDRVLKKIEDTRMREEMKLTQKLQNMFNGQALAMDGTQVDQVQQKASAPEVVPTVVEAVPTPVAVEEFKKVKITPLAGVTMMKTDSINFESTYNAGLNVDSRLTKNFAVGIGFNYTNMTIKDVTNSNNPYYSGPSYSPYTSPYSYSPYSSYSYSPYSYSPNYGDYYSWYNTQYGTREINFSEINFDLTGKFYIIGTGVVQPYVGAGVGYNRTKMAYDQKQQSTYTGSYSPYSNVSFGEESYTGSFVSGILLAGTDVMFTDMLGLNFQFKYAKGLTSGTSTDQGILANPDQLFLNQLGQEIDKSGQVSITGGLNVAF